MNLAVAQRARLEERLLAVERRSTRGSRTARHVRVALETKQVHVADPQHVDICSPMGGVARRAALDFHRFMFVYEWPLFVGMTLETDLILGRSGSQLLWPYRSVRVMAVRALDQAFIHAMMKRHGKLRLLLLMACVTERGFSLDE